MDSKAISSPITVVLEPFIDEKVSSFLNIIRNLSNSTNIQLRNKCLENRFNEFIQEVIKYYLTELDTLQSELETVESTTNKLYKENETLRHEKLVDDSLLETKNLLTETIDELKKQVKTSEDEIIRLKKINKSIVDQLANVSREVEKSTTSLRNYSNELTIQNNELQIQYNNLLLTRDQELKNYLVVIKENENFRQDKIALNNKYIKLENKMKSLEEQNKILNEDFKSLEKQLYYPVNILNKLRLEHDKLNSDFKSLNDNNEQINLLLSKTKQQIQIFENLHHQNYILLEEDPVYKIINENYNQVNELLQEIQKQLDEIVLISNHNIDIFIHLYINSIAEISFLNFIDQQNITS